MSLISTPVDARFGLAGSNSCRAAPAAQARGSFEHEDAHS